MRCWWFLVIYKSWQIQAAGLLLELCMQISRGCCDFLKVHPVGGNYPSGNQHDIPAWEKQSHLQARFGWGYVRSQEG